MYGVVIPNKYGDVIQPLVASIKDKIPYPPPIVVVMDGHENDYGFHGIRYDDPHFAFPRAANMGMRELPGRDIILMNDDCVLTEWNFFARLREMAYANPLIGILSPLVIGCVGNPVQRWHERAGSWKVDMDFIDVLEPSPICFPCVYLKRRMLDQIGPMKETYAGYGGDDVNLSHRARVAGWKTMVTQRVTVQHGDGSPDLSEGRGKSWATSFMRRWPGRGAPTQAEINSFIGRTQH